MHESNGMVLIEIKHIIIPSNVHFYVTRVVGNDYSLLFGLFISPPSTQLFRGGQRPSEGVESRYNLQAIQEH